MKLETIKALDQAWAARRPMVLAKNLANGTEFLLPDPQAPALLNTEAENLLRLGKTGTFTVDGDVWFIEARNPPPRLFLVGAVHIAQTLAPLAASMGFDVTIIDPRDAFRSADRFPATALEAAWPDAAIDTLQPDFNTAIVTLTHDPKLDDPALDRALHSDAFYIGALGSRKTHAARLERLHARGHEPTSLSRIHAPVGLDIAAVTPSEIALSIIAEIVAARRGSELAVRRPQSSGAPP